MTVMTNKEFVKKAKDIANNYKTLYVLGCFGSPMNDSNKKRYTANNSFNKSRTSIIKSVSSDTFGFDCVCLIKGILWGWNGNVNQTYGGAIYNCKGVPDVGADQMMNYCTGVSSNFKNIEVGEVVHMSGHIGIYIGDGLAVECTPAWKNKVQITAVGNIGKKAGYNTRTWANHGKLNFIKYEKINDNKNNNTSTNNPTDTKVNVFYKVKTRDYGWLPEVKNLNDYAGWENSPITDVAIKVDKGTIEYQVHVKGQGWLPKVTGYNIKDSKNGYAGNGKPIDAIKIYYYTPEDIRPYKKAKYKVNGLPWQTDTDVNNKMEGYAGIYGRVITKLEIVIE